MNQSIKVKETEVVKREVVETEYTYEELLDLFGENSIVYQLVKRCQQNEERIEELRRILQTSMDAYVDILSAKGKIDKSFKEILQFSEAESNA